MLIGTFWKVTRVVCFVFSLYIKCSYYCSIINKLNPVLEQTPAEKLENFEMVFDNTMTHAAFLAILCLGADWLIGRK